MPNHMRLISGVLRSAFVFSFDYYCFGTVIVLQCNRIPGSLATKAEQVQNWVSSISRFMDKTQHVPERRTSGPG